MFEAIRKFIGARRGGKSAGSTAFFHAQVEAMRLNGPIEIMFSSGARVMAVGRPERPYTPFLTLTVEPSGPSYPEFKELRDSIHGHDSGLRHRGCGGEIYYDWTLQYIEQGENVPALRCTVCKKEIGGDREIEDFDGM